MLAGVEGGRGEMAGWEGGAFCAVGEEWGDGGCWWGEWRLWLRCHGYDDIYADTAHISH